MKTLMRQLMIVCAAAVTAWGVLTAAVIVILGYVGRMTDVEFGRD